MVLAISGSAGAATGYISTETSVGTIDTGTFAAAPLGAMSEEMNAFARGPSGELLGLDTGDTTEQELHRINRSTGVNVALGPLLDPGATDQFFFGFTTRANTDVLAAAVTANLSGISTQLHRVNLSTGAAVPVGAAQTGVGVASLAGSCGGGLLGADTDFNLVRVNPATGAVTIIGPLAPGVTGSDSISLAWEHGTRRLFALATTDSGADRIYRVNPATGALTQTPFVNQAGPAANPYTLAIDAPSQCRYRRALSLRVSGRRRIAKGRVKTDWTACRAGQRVTIFRKRPGPDKRLGSDRTNRRGAYKEPVEGEAGTLYAQIKQSSGQQGICLAERSRTWRLT